MAEKSGQQSSKIIVNTDTIIGSIYSQLVGITVTDIDTTLEFVFINPRDKRRGQVVSRITLPRSTAENLSKAIIDTISKHDANKKKS